MRTVAICDDDGLQLRASEQVLIAFAQGNGIDLHIVLFDDVEECIRNAGNFDVVFMDVEFDTLPRGIDAVYIINQVAPDCQVVYLTNYVRYSLDVYQTNHAWYVLKNQLAQRLPEIFQKLTLVESARRSSIVISSKDDGRLANIPCVRIRYLERKDRVTRIITLDGTYHVREKLVDLLEKLPEDSFARCHNSYVVNLRHVAEIRATDMILDDGTQVFISRSYSRHFREKYLLWAEAWTV